MATTVRIVSPSLVVGLYGGRGAQGIGEGENWGELGPVDSAIASNRKELGPKGLRILEGDIAG